MNSNNSAGLLALPHHIVSCHICQFLAESELRQLRCVSKQLYAAANHAIRHLSPTQSSSDIISLFPSIQTLDFSAIPADAWNESSLEVLTKAHGLYALRFGQHTQLTSYGTHLLSALSKKLTSIECIDVHFTDTSLSHLSALTSLTSLSLLGCRKITEEALVNVVSCLRNLKHIELGSCTGVGDTVLAALGSLSTLCKVDLSSCDAFTEHGLSALGNSHSIRTLLLPACWHIDDVALHATCTAMPHLECLSLFEAGEGVSDHGLQSLSLLTGLTALDLGYSCWGHSEIGLTSVISCLPSLQMLNIGGAEGVTDAVLRVVADKLHSLTMLDISECQQIRSDQQGGGVHHLSKLTTLQELHVGWNLRFGDASILSSLPPHLTKLDLSYCSEITLESLNPLSLPRLAHLQVRRCCRIRDAGLAALTTAAPNLMNVDMSYCSSITSSGLRCLSSLTKLSSLTLSGCTKAVTVLGLGYLAHVPSLIHLEVCNTPRLDDGCLQAVSFVRQLKHLSIRGCYKVSNHGILALHRIHRLETLEIDGRHISAQTIRTLQSKLPRLRRVVSSYNDYTRQLMERYEINSNNTVVMAL